MKAAVLEGPERITVRDVPKPKPGKSEVLIKVRCCGICGSDLDIYRISFGEGVKRIMGHEFSGDIVELGPEVEGWEVGDRVVVEPSIVCWECYWCRRHQYNLCPSLGFTGIVIDGGFAEFVKVPAYQLHRLPKEVTYEQGAVVEPLAVALHGVRLSGLKAGDTIAVFGCGPIGLLTIMWARAGGADKIYATDIAESRIAAAEKLADAVINPKEVDPVIQITELTDGIGPDIVFECSGSAAAEVQALNLVRRGGQIVILGVPHEEAKVNFMPFVTKEIGIKGGLAYASLLGRGEFTSCINFLKSKRINISPVVSAKIALEDIVDKGFKRVILAEELKVLVTPKTSPRKDS